MVYDTVSHDSPGDYRFSEVGFHFTYEGASGYVHMVRLDGLRPGTVYYFRCGRVGGWSEERCFRTVPLPLVGGYSSLSSMCFLGNVVCVV